MNIPHDDLWGVEAQKPKYEGVNPYLGLITTRTIASLIRTQGIGDMYRMYLGAQRDGLDYHLAVIPADFQEKSKGSFDIKYMAKLFDLGCFMAKEGYPWEKVAPDMDSE